MDADLAAQRAFDRLAKFGFEKLTETDKTVAAAWQFAAGVSNAGFARYFSSTRDDLAFYAPTALRNIDAKQLAEIAADANAVFTPDGPPGDRKMRHDRIRMLPESVRRLFDALEVRVDKCDEDKLRAGGLPPPASGARRPTCGDAAAATKLTTSRSVGAISRLLCGT